MIAAVKLYSKNYSHTGMAPLVCVKIGSSSMRDSVGTRTMR